MKYYISPPPANPFARLVAALVGAVVLLGAFFFGLVVVTAMVTLAALTGLILWLRSRWLGRSSVPDHPVDSPEQDSGNIINAEYTVVSRRRD